MMMSKYQYSSGNVNEDVNFEYGEGTTAAYGCGVVFKGEYFYFGGNGAANVRQVRSRFRPAQLAHGYLQFDREFR